MDDPADAISSGPLFATVHVEDVATLGFTTSDGDLWPSCWADDDALYTANGDGKAFDGPPPVDIAVSRVTGSPFTDPPRLDGTTLAKGDALGQVWTPGEFTRKPTGMICVDGAIYLAVQDLANDFMEAPAATIAVSKDRGATWSWDKTKPMFDDRVMTTLMFLDFGKNNVNAIDEYVYVYGLDENWRFSTRVASPTKLWLARVPKDRIQDKSSWTYFAGMAGETPRFEADLARRVPVLEDATRVYTKPFDATLFGRDAPTISQGGIVYNAPLRRYLYTSWTEYTFELFEAPAPWGPWTKFFSRDFGRYPWTVASHGGYGLTIPSKFISPDGKTMFVQSNTFVGGVKNYHLSLRKLTIEPFVPSKAKNEKDPEKNLALEPGTVPIARAARGGSMSRMNDGDETQSIDSSTGESKSEDFWGYVWPRAYRVSTIAYTTGTISPEGGSFADLRAQVRRNGKWTDVAFAPQPVTGSNQTYVFSFSPVAADGVRIIGTPGGTKTFTSIAELAVYFR